MKLDFIQEHSGINMARIDGIEAIFAKADVDGLLNIPPARRRHKA